MHVLLIASFAPSLLNFRGPLIRDLVLSGHRVSVTAPDFTPDIKAALHQLGANCVECPLERTGTSFLADLSYYRALRKVIRDVSPEIALTYTIKPNIWGAFAASREGVKSVAMVTGLGYAFTNAGKMTLRHRFINLIVRLLYRRATSLNEKVVFQNPDDITDFQDAGCLTDASKALLVNGSGVDVTHFAKEPLPEAPVFLMIARLLKNKGVKEYAEAALRIQSEYPEARFLLAGPFDDGPDAINQADLENWQSRGLTYLGELHDVRPILAQAQVFVLPSYREGTPRTVLEAMAVGRAILTTDAPGCRETIRHGIEGLLIPVRDSDALSIAMKEMITNPARTIKMAHAARTRASEKYDVHKVNKALMGHLGLSTLPDAPQITQKMRSS